jgi:hypothetical protein
MADISFECPECKQHLVIDAGNAGAKIQCPTCLRLMTVPQRSRAAPVSHGAGLDLRSKLLYVKLLGALISVVVLIVVCLGCWYYGVHRPYQLKVKKEQEEARLREEQQRQSEEKDKKLQLEMDQDWTKFKTEMDHKLAMVQPLKDILSDNPDINQRDQNLTELKSAAEQGNVSAQVAVGIAYFFSHRETVAVDWFRKAAAQGDSDGEYWLGRCFFYGKGVQQNMVQGVQLWKLSANHGNQYAEYCLGAAYVLGSGVPKDFRTGVVWLHKSAEQGDDEAKEILKELGLK